MSRPLSNMRPRAAQGCIADAMVEADPVDPISAPSSIAVAQLDSPVWRVGAGDIAQRAFHRRMLLGHTARLPLAVYPDVERDRVIKDRPSARAGRS